MLYPMAVLTSAVFSEPINISSSVNATWTAVSGQYEVIILPSTVIGTQNVLITVLLNPQVFTVISCPKVSLAHPITSISIRTE